MLIFSNEVAKTIDALVADIKPAGVAVIVDTNTAALVLPRLREQSAAIGAAKVVTTLAGEMHKDVDALQSVWKQLDTYGVTRQWLVVNLGGGIVTDLGAFAASTFRRGVKFVNIPTTLLGAVDASLGAKCGINFCGLKNGVGLFSDPEMVIVSTTFFRTLTSQELLSGYAEMVKHAYLESPAMVSRVLAYHILDYDPNTLLELIEASVNTKARIVKADPREGGLRKALNLGHTFGHAFEELALRRRSPLPHGYAVAQGMVAALVLSHLKEGFDSAQVHRFASWVKETYGTFPISCDDYDSLLADMHRDKKNPSAATTAPVMCTLLRTIGDPVVNVPASEADLRQALDLYRDLMGVG